MGQGIPSAFMKRSDEDLETGKRNINVLGVYIRYSISIYQKDISALRNEINSTDVLRAKMNHHSCLLFLKHYHSHSSQTALTLDLSTRQTVIFGLSHRTSSPIPLSFLW